MNAATGRVRGLLLTHGAGGDKEHHALQALESALVPLPVVRVNFPYREAGRKAPDRAPKLLEFLHATAQQTAEQLHIAPEELALGGRSLGGRICSMAVAEGLPAAGLVLLSYPLHPPGRPERLRVEHFADLRVPCLFVSGDRDPFGSPEEFKAQLMAIPAPVEVRWLAGQRHDPKPAADPDICETVQAWLRR